MFVDLHERDIGRFTNFRVNSRIRTPLLLLAARPWQSCVHRGRILGANIEPNEVESD